ncbi:N-acetyltransferase [Lysobacter dokdonensis DS-58]|uniref:N-acetyltransferase n=1 Tax=Lysobacter dokdonensis DS-58 TaxID=1300345 RepID=A0A0A2WIL8_9GAMM|nr:GNAT family N-acetyltransferase [Lysobacter dokdonensis]KGQ19623.1 N-acetyltransferase [Lysobacter dokdonensis DS-58]
MSEVVLVERFPGVEDYLRLRKAAGMHSFSQACAVRGLPKTVYGVHLSRDGEVVAMGRVVGDGGCFFLIVDIAVAPELQGQGLGKRIMGALDAWLRANVPPSAYVSLVADGDAKYLYEKFGFVESAPVAVNMEYIMGVDGSKSTSHLDTSGKPARDH